MHPYATRSGYFTFISIRAFIMDYKYTLWSSKTRSLKMSLFALLQSSTYPRHHASAHLTRHLSSQVSAPKSGFRNFSTATYLRKTAADHVPVTTYDGNPGRTMLQVDQSQPSLGAGPIEDLTRKAEKFDRNILPKLNHTMIKFTLDGKVALVTG